MKIRLVCTCLLFSAISQLQAQLEISPQGRFLVDEKGKPFFWLGDTGWGLFQIPDRDEVKYYLKTRSKQGFSVIHAAVFHKNPFIKPGMENAYGDKAFENEDILQPIETSGDDPGDEAAYDYWDHVEFVIKEADRNNLQILFLPIFTVKEGDGYSLIHADNARKYGQFLGDRFKGHSNIIWCMGGDVLADNDQKKNVWNELAEGVREGLDAKSQGEILMTYHVRGGHTSSDYFPESNWLDFHMLQTWDSYHRIYDAVSTEYQRSPIKPVLHGEGAYEDGPEYPTKPITPHVIRKQFYWAYFAGGMHTYGNSNVWNFGSNKDYVSSPWMEAVRSNGATQLTIARSIMESLNWSTLVPDNTVFLENGSEVRNQNVAMVSPGFEQIAIYTAEPSKIKVNQSLRGEGKYKKAMWINPENGQKRILKGLTGEYETPSGWSDGILVIK